MIGIFKTNNIETIGGTVPQNDGVSMGGDIKGWVVVDVPDDKISSVQEFNIQPVADDFIEAIRGPQQEGAYNAQAFGINGIGDKMRFENNPGQFNPGELDSNGNQVQGPEYKDETSKKSATAEDVAPYKEAYQFIKKYNAKSVLRNNIRGNIKDVEDDIADTKVALQAAMYYMAYEWKGRTDAERSNNPNRENMNKLSDKILSDKVKMRADLTNGLDKLDEILTVEEEINTLITDTYKYNDTRGL